MNIKGYVYKNEVYSERETVFDSMILNKDYNSKIQFSFYEDVFDAINWQVEPSTDISILYKLRAQQLRDKYDYLILLFSGGSDSVQILNTFLKNNIFIDEIQITHHSEMINRLDRNALLNDPALKEFLEYEYAALPMLKKVSELSPSTKITTLDASQYISDQFFKKQFTHLSNDKNFVSGHQKLYVVMPRASLHYINYHNVFVKEPPNNSCLIRGFEKPILYFEYGKNRLCFSFNDMVMHNVIKYSRKELPDWLSTEDFFWSKDAPLIPVKQSHMIKRVLEHNKEFYDGFVAAKVDIFKHSLKNKAGYSPAINFDRMYNDIIYPDWNNTIFTANKPSTVIPEFKLAETVSGQHQALDFVNEVVNYYENKYSLIANKKQFKDILYTKPYIVGDLSLSWLD